MNSPKKTTRNTPSTQPTSVEEIAKMHEAAMQQRDQLAAQEMQAFLSQFQAKWGRQLVARPVFTDDGRVAAELIIIRV